MNVGLKQVNVNYFAIFDGHGGDKTAEEANANLHKYIINEGKIFDNAIENILRGYEKMELHILTKNISDKEKSGSSAISAIVIGIFPTNIDNNCYIANLGDSKAIISRSLGLRINTLTKQHVPTSSDEKVRIIKYGGTICEQEFKTFESDKDYYAYTTFPGELGVTRSFGDIKAKIPQCGGKPGIVIAVPDIISFKITDDADFILMVSNSIFEKLNNRDLVIIVLETYIYCIEKNMVFYDFLGEVVKNILTEAIDKDVKDNMSCVFICLDNLYTQYKFKDLRNITRTLDVIMQVECDQFFNDTIHKKFYTEPAEPVKKESQNTLPQYTAVKPSKKKGFSCCGLFS
jgi:protein phosphatase 2C family protein 2/3